MCHIAIRFPPALAEKHHRNAACRGEREKAIVFYEQLTPQQKDQIPQDLRVWLRYRSEKYFGPHRTAPGTKRKGGLGRKND